MKLRWYKHIHYYWNWDDRHEVYYKSAMKREFVLQYEDEEGHWVNVPYVVDETSEEKPE